jgi:hypothetical protein
MKILINVFKFIFVAGLLTMGTAVYLDSYKVASLSSLKSVDKRMQLEAKDKYTTPAPDMPVDESNYILPPAAPDKDATQEQKDAYEKAKTDHLAKSKEFREKYDADMKAYNLAYKEYQRKQRTLDLEKQKNSSTVKKASDALAKKIEFTQLSINEFLLPTILRYIGCIVLLLGSLGILMFGEMYERLGVLIVLGFGFKTIIGL